MDTVLFLADEESRAALDIRRLEFGSDDDDDVDRDDGMRLSNLLADAFIARTIFLCWGLPWMLVLLLLPFDLFYRWNIVFTRQSADVFFFFFFNRINEN
jgi:hypothetical protein